MTVDIPTLSLFTTFNHTSCLARCYFTIARKMLKSCEGKYTISR